MAYVHGVDAYSRNGYVYGSRLSREEFAAELEEVLQALAQLVAEMTSASYRNAPPLPANLGKGFYAQAYANPYFSNRSPSLRSYRSSLDSVQYVNGGPDAPLGLTQPYINPQTGAIDADSTVFVDKVYNEADRLGIQRDELVDHTLRHEKKHQHLNKNGFVVVNSRYAKLHEDAAEDETIHKEKHGGALSTFIAFDFWGRKPNIARSAYADLATAIQSALRKTFGAEQGNEFIAEYNNALQYLPPGMKPVDIYLNLIRKYGAQIGMDPLTAEGTLVDNYVDMVDTLVSNI